MSQDKLRDGLVELEWERSTNPILHVGVLVTVLSPAAIGDIGDGRAVWFRAAQ